MGLPRFLTNDQMLALVFEPNTAKPTPTELAWDKIVASQQPRALPAYSGSAQSAIPGLSLSTPASQGLDEGVEGGDSEGGA